MHKSIRTRISFAIMGMLANYGVSAGSFSLYTESNGYSIGNFAAGVAAEAYDASTGWYNPAGLALIRKQQMILGGVGVFPLTSLSGTTQFNTIEPNVPSYVQSFQNINGAENGVVPSFYYAYPLSFGKDWTFALSVVAPFGLSTNWAPTSPVRYAATLSDLFSVDISPEIGGKLTENFAVGAGIDLQYASVKFNSILGSPALLQALGESPTLWDSSVTNNGNSFAVGFHTGVLLMMRDNHTRLGVNYQSKITHHFTGNSQLMGPLASSDFLGGVLSNDAVFSSDTLRSNPINFPDIITLSGYHDLNKKWAS